MDFEMKQPSEAATNSHPKINDKVTKKPKKFKKEGKEDDDLGLTTCGFGSFRPAWLQFFATPLWFLVNISFVGICQGMASGLIYTVMNTLEKRYPKKIF